MIWHEHRMVVLDLETTSIDVDEARIVSAAVGLVGGGLPTVMETFLVNPGVPIPEEATEIHGITNEYVQMHGADPAVVILSILSTIAAWSGYALVVFNARYDLTVLAREAKRHDCWALMPEPLWVIDPLVIDKWLDTYRSGLRRLHVMCEHYGAKLDGAHDAGYDAMAAGRLAWVMAKKGRVIRRVRDQYEADEFGGLAREWDLVKDDLELLHRAQVLWAASQAADLEKHFKKQGEPKVVPREWPVIP